MHLFHQRSYLVSRTKSTVLAIIGVCTCRESLDKMVPFQILCTICFILQKKKLINKKKRGGGLECTFVTSNICVVHFPLSKSLKTYELCDPVHDGVCTGSFLPLVYTFWAPVPLVDGNVWDYWSIKSQKPKTWCKIRRYGKSIRFLVRVCKVMQSHFYHNTGSPSAALHPYSSNCFKSKVIILYYICTCMYNVHVYIRVKIQY